MKTWQDLHQNPYAWPGGYPLYGLTTALETICPKCAAHDPGDLLEICTNWEDPHLFCDGCNVRIPSAYAEED